MTIKTKRTQQGNLLAFGNATTMVLCYKVICYMVICYVVICYMIICYMVNYMPTWMGKRSRGDEVSQVGFGPI